MLVLTQFSLWLHSLGDPRVAAGLEPTNWLNGLSLAKWVNASLAKWLSVCL